jgi:hypothetical protein
VYVQIRTFLFSFKLCAWIENSRSILGPKYTEIGSSCSEAMQLLAEHEQFAKVCLVSIYVFSIVMDMSI